MSERILLVDDHPLTRSALAALLQQQGFQVVGEAADGNEAIAKAGDLRPDLVLLDLSMPGLDGLEALTRMLAVSPPPEILVHSGFDAAGMRDRVLALGAARYLEKGGKLNEVRDAVREVIVERRGRQA